MFLVEPDELIARILAQNDLLIATLTANQPVEVIKALNPAPIYASRTPEPWSDDPPRPETGDMWGDPDVPTADLLAMGTGWVGGGDNEPAEGQPD